jgi:Mycothiol maleylpyruvate isomerase N-terminal domain
MKPVETIAACVASHQLLLARLAPLTDDDFRAPSSLPHYSPGHLVTHIANRAKAHVQIFGVPRRARSAVTCASVALYRAH